MIAGYILNRFKSPPKVSPFINLILWAMSLCIMFLLVFGVWNGSLNPTWTAIYVSLGHTGRQAEHTLHAHKRLCARSQSPRSEWTGKFDEIRPTENRLVNRVIWKYVRRVLTCCPPCKIRDIEFYIISAAMHNMFRVIIIFDFASARTHTHSTPIVWPF